MIGPQFKLTGPSAIGMSTELSTISDPFQWWAQPNILQPVFHIIELEARYGINVQWSFREIFEDEDNIELLQTKLHAFQRCDLNFSQSNHQKWRIGQMDQTFGRGL